MGKAGYNERKDQILGHVCQCESASSSDLASALGISLQTASELLRRYEKQGLLRRYRARQKGGPPKSYVYQISPSGEAKRDGLEVYDCVAHYDHEGDRYILRFEKRG